MAKESMMMQADLSRKPERYRTVPTQDAFLTAFARIGNVTEACEALNEGGIPLSRYTVVSWQRKNSHGFRDRMDEAHEAYADRLEGKATRLIHDLKPGQSPLMLIAALNANRPDKWRPNANSGQEDNTKALLSEIRLKLSASREGIEVSVSTEERPLSQPDDESGIIEAEA